MIRAKDIVVRPISIQDANRVVRKFHYSGSVTNNSQLNFGVFLGKECHGAMQFGPPMDRRKVINLVRHTSWNGFLELNRMAFGPALPRNSESRALSVAFGIIRKHYKQIEWILSFADGAQCGDGAIYRATGFILTAIKRNTQIVQFPDGYRTTRAVLTNTTRPKRKEVAKKYGIKLGGGSSLKPFINFGARFMPGYQFRYVYFLNKETKHRLTVPEIPYYEIDKLGAGMYLGKTKRALSKDSVAVADQATEGGAIPTDALQIQEAANG